MKIRGWWLVLLSGQAVWVAEYRLQEMRGYEAHPAGAREERRLFAYAADGGYRETILENSAMQQRKTVLHFDARHAPLATQHYEKTAQGDWRLQEESLSRYEAGGGQILWESRDYRSDREDGIQGRREQVVREGRRETATSSALRAGNWQADGQTRHEKDEQGRVQRFETARWDEAKQAFVPHVREEYRYLADGGEETDSFVWRDGAWQADGRKIVRQGGDGFWQRFVREKHFVREADEWREDNQRVIWSWHLGGLLLEWDESRHPLDNRLNHKVLIVRPWHSRTPAHDVLILGVNRNTRQWRLAEYERVVRDAVGRVGALWQRDMGGEFHTHYQYDADGLLRETQTVARLAQGAGQVSRTVYVFDKRVAAGHLFAHPGRQRGLPKGIRAPFALSAVRTYRLLEGDYVLESSREWRYEKFH